MRLGELGEFGLIDRIARRVTLDNGVRLGIGDDAAAIEPDPGCVTLVTSDMLLEGIHFDLTFCEPVGLGRKSLAVNLSDIAAMGGNPRFCLLCLAVPDYLTVEFVDSFMSGFLEMAAEHHVQLIGGDTCASRSGLVITVTAIGEQLPELLATRNGARSGDLILVTGTLGDSALGLRLLRDGVRSGNAVRKHLDPHPRVREGLALAAANLPTAMIDISDGLLADLGHILDRSGVGARIELEKLPLSADFAAHRHLFAEDPFQLPLAGGEDYELLFTIPPSQHGATIEALGPSGTTVSVIGTITATGVEVIDRQGNSHPLAARGFTHFATAH